MRLMPTVVLMSILFSMTVVVAAQPALATGPENQRAFYNTTIESIVINCENKGCLKESRSAYLRRCADAAVQKADFLRRNKEQLIEVMMAEQLPLKRYRVEHYVNMSFNGHLQSKP